MSGATLYDKLWKDHVVRQNEDGSSLIYIDRHLLHEVTSPQAFEGLETAGRQLWRRDGNLAMEDHNVPTVRIKENLDPITLLSLQALERNCANHGIPRYAMGDRRQGIVHVVGLEQGFTLPGATVVCGDSHTSTHGALGALAFGIGTSEVEQVLATQCLALKKSRNMLVEVRGKAGFGITAKDFALAIIGHIGTAGATGCALEFAGEAVSELSMEGRMTLCNMSIEAGARFGLVGVDDKTLEYVHGRPCAPSGELWDLAMEAWRGLHSDQGSRFDVTVNLAAGDILPQVTWGTSPEMVVPIDGVVPDPANESDKAKAQGMERALKYMDLEPGRRMTDIQLDTIFLGSCTNSRIEDLRAAAAVVRGRKVAANIKRVLVVPGSGLVKHQAEQEGLAQIFIDAGFEWREPGCSMCLGMNPDRLAPGERCASTSNRNFEGRQGQGGRTHLLSPAMAAAAAIAGSFVDVREFIRN
ncbi:MAG: 3-isopropylmalate dehydratase large subunit [Candidatus Eutrophobiaceae bacterium]